MLLYKIQEAGGFNCPPLLFWRLDAKKFGNYSFKIFVWYKDGDGHERRTFLCVVFCIMILLKDSMVTFIHTVFKLFIRPYSTSLPAYLTMDIWFSS